MGSFPRSYGRRINWGGLLTPAIKALLIANAAVFLLQTLVRLFFGGQAEFALIQLFGLVPRGVTHGLRFWQPFTYLFLHGGLWHVLLNMLVLWMFGSDLERSWGRRRFFTYYFLTGAGAAVINIVVKTLSDPAGIGSSLQPTIGASGAIFGILLASALVFPDRQVWLIPFPVTLPMRIYVFIIGAIAFFGSLGASGDNISHISHLGGMIFGFAYLRGNLWWYRLRNNFYDWKRQRLRRKFEVYMRERDGERGDRRPGGWVN
ncbi:MAG TPA: rhomboid family intramembrane serine protease [Candidatus Acidoferrales bacterium]